MQRVDQRVSTPPTGKHPLATGGPHLSPQPQVPIHGVHQSIWTHDPARPLTPSPHHRAAALAHDLAHALDGETLGLLIAHLQHLHRAPASAYTSAPAAPQPGVPRHKGRWAKAPAQPQAIPQHKGRWAAHPRTRAVAPPSPPHRTAIPTCTLPTPAAPAIARTRSESTSSQSTLSSASSAPAPATPASEPARLPPAAPKTAADDYAAMNRYWAETYEGAPVFRKRRGSAEGGYMRAQPVLIPTSALERRRAEGGEGREVLLALLGGARV